MKKLFLIGSCFLGSYLCAQEPADALRYSWTVPGGTARQQAIGGAMGSLGGDVSATFVNPAGLAFYKTGDFAVTPLFRSGTNKASYLNRTETADFNKLNLGTTGIVVAGGGNGRNIRNATFSFAYNRNADFNNSILYRGQNTKTSYSQKFLEEIKNNNDKDPNSVSKNYPFGTSLAFNTYWIDTVAGGSPGNYNFQSRSANILSTGLLQQQTITTRGGINEFAFAGAVNLNDKVMLGGTLGVPVINYSRDATFREEDATKDTLNKFDFATLYESLTTKGVGVNVRLGAIFKAAENVRLGLIFMTPTVYNLTDNNYAEVTVNTEKANGEQTQNSLHPDLSPGGAASEFKYTLITPYKVTGSISYVLHEVADVSQQNGFITADVEYVNYKAASFQTAAQNGSDQTTVDYLHTLNTAISNAYKGAMNFRVGGELKFTTLMVRGGFAYYGNPYQNINGENGSKVNISGGLGYRNNGMFVDLTYIQSLNKDVHFPYRLESAPNFGATIKSGVSNVLLTVGFKF